MTEPDYDDTYDDDDSGEELQPRGNKFRERIKRLEEKAKRADDLEKQLNERNRKDALASVGKDLTERQQKALLRTMEEDGLDARQAAEELGFVPADTSAADEAAALNRMSEASNGSSVDPADEDPVSRLERAYAEGGPEGLKAQIERDGNRVASYE